MLTAPQHDDSAPTAAQLPDEPQPAPAQVVPTLSRRKALTVALVIASLLGVLWFGDVLSGVVPKNVVQPSLSNAGAYTVNLNLDTAHPAAGQDVHARLTITNAKQQPVTAATVTYQWTMVTMDMGTTHGIATPTAPQGTYVATVSALMGGYWRLSVTIHTPNLPDGSTSFDLPIQG